MKKIILLSFFLHLILLQYPWLEKRINYKSQFNFTPILVTNLGAFYKYPDKKISKNFQGKVESAKEKNSSNILTLPDLISLGNPPPQYPIEALENKWQGVVELKLQIESTGRVSNIKVVSSSGYEILDNEAIKTARQWIMPKSHLNTYVIPIEFRIQ